jgi:hypothetical protein
MDLLRDLLYSECRNEIREVIDDLAEENADLDEEDSIDTDLDDLLDAEDFNEYREDDE